jgi:hypothetical protein
VNNIHRHEEYIMGCDIHLAVERRVRYLSQPNDTWERAERVVPSRWSGEGMEREDWYDNRNYSLFAILAGVRNGSGFAGTDLGDPVVPISEPRGVPEDVSDEVRKEIEQWDIDGHSHSWFTIGELLAFDWDQKITHRAWVRRQSGHPRNRQDETPDEYAARIQKYANEYGHLPPAEHGGWEMCGWSSEGQGASGWRTIEWREPYWETTGASWWACVARMARLAGDDLSSVRTVFFFDN